MSCVAFNNCAFLCPLDEATVLSEALVPKQSQGSFSLSLWFDVAVCGAV